MAEALERNASATEPPAMPERLPSHWVCIGLFMVATLSAFWQHGHAGFTMAALVSAPFLGLTVYLPMKLFNSFARGLLQTLLLLCGGLWAVYRFKEWSASPDVLLTEALCVAGLSFMPQAENDRYRYMNAISMVLLFYGSVFPRAVYLYLFPLGLLLGMLALYLTRPAALSGTFKAVSPKGALTRNWHFIALHACIITGLFVAAYSIFPFEGVSGKGVFMVSFKSDNDNYAPEELKKWMKSSLAKAGEGKGKADLRNAPLSFSSDAKNVVESLPLMADSLVSGSGSAVSGDRLLFKVFCPVKLYWLCRLYDQYDGKAWVASERLERGKLKYDSDIWEGSESVEQRFLIEERFSRSLPSAYLPISMAPDLWRAVKTDSGLYGYRFSEGAPFPSFPFSYSVVSRVPFQDAPPPPPVALIGEDGKVKPPLDWMESVPKRNYLSLPKGKVSERLRELSRRVSSKGRTPYEKAVALRDWLRENFKYEQFSTPPPEGAESVDYFIFELKKGHCEYFASAMTVMARVAGLPSRVATGFSPGNYDVLSKSFSVYEYHAHAWSQVFIEGTGWLTFDATPPGHVLSRSTPFGFAALQDPFGDEWRIKPPELAKGTQTYLKLKKARDEMLSKNLSEMEGAGAGAAILTAISKVPLTREELEDCVNALKRRGVEEDSVIRKGGPSFFGIVKSNLATSYEKLKRVLRKSLEWIAGPSGLSLMAITAIVMASYWLYVLIMEKSRRDRLIAKALKRFDRAKERVGGDPSFAIAQCYRMARDMLELSGRPRLGNLDLFDYGKSLESWDADLSRNALALFFLYSRMEYSAAGPDAGDSYEALRRAEAIRDFLMRLM